MSLQSKRQTDKQHTTAFGSSSECISPVDHGLKGLKARIFGIFSLLQHHSVSASDVVLNHPSIIYADVSIDSCDSTDRIHWLWRSAGENGDRNYFSGEITRRRNDTTALVLQKKNKC